MEGIGKSVGYRIDRSACPRVRRIEAAEDDRKRDEKHKDDNARKAHRYKVLDVADADLACVFCSHEGQRDG